MQTRDRLFEYYRQHQSVAKNYTNYVMSFYTRSEGSDATMRL